MKQITKYQTARSTIIAAQCIGFFSFVLIQESPIIILYTTLLGCSEFVGIASTAFTGIASFIFGPFSAIIVDRIGKKRIMTPSYLISALAFGLLALVPLASQGRNWLVLGCLALYSSCFSIGNAGWFPLLKDIVPQPKLGEFFGVLRASWTLVSMVLIFLLGLWVDENASIPLLQFVIVVAAIFAFVRVLLILPLPEKPQPAGLPVLSIKTTISIVFAHAERRRFYIYVFLLNAFIGCTVPVGYVLAKNGLQMSDSYVINLTSVILIAQVAGYIVGGYLNDKYGAGVIFRLSHFGFAVVCFLFLGVHSSAPLLWNQIALALLTACFGFFFSAFSIAVTTELFALSHPKVAASVIAFGSALNLGGFAFSRIFAGWVLDGDLLDSWEMVGVTFTGYHAVLLAAGFGVLATSFMLTFVPSVGRQLKP